MSDAAHDAKERLVRRDAEILRVTSACQQRCVFCNAREDIGQPTTGELRARIGALADEGLQRLVLSGGEPSLRPDLLELIAHAQRRGIAEIEIQTNAIRCADGGYATELAAAGVTSAFVALHAHEAELSDALTGAPGTFTRTKAGIRALLAARLPTTLNFVTNRRNYPFLPDYVRFVHRQLAGVAALSFSFVMSGGSAFRNRWIIPRMSEVAPYLRAAYACCQERGIPFSNPGCGVPVCFVPGYEQCSDEFRQLCGAELRTLAELRNNQQEKEKVEACAACVHDPCCLGVWKGYLAVHGGAEIRPVREGEAGPPPAEPAPAGVSAVPPPPIGLRQAPPANEVLRLTLKCNERCLFCNVPVEGEPSFAAPSTDEAKRRIDRFAERTAGTRTELSFSGGEPLLRQDLEELVAYARGKGIERVQLQTNATLLDRKRARALRAAGLTNAFVAYHSHEADVQNTLTGIREDAGEATRKGIRAAIAAGIPVSVNPVLTRLNLPSFPDFVDHLAEAVPEVEVVCVTLVQPHGRAAAHPELLPRYDEARPALDEALSRAAAHGIRMDTHFTSLPLCFLPEGQAAEALELRENERLRDRPAGEPLDERIRRVIAGKTHGPPCTYCVWKNFCNGVWRAYVRRYGWAHVRPPRRSRTFWGRNAAPGSGDQLELPRALILKMMSRCNNGCRVCFERGRVCPEKTAALSAALARGRREDAEQVTFTGQEPTLHAELAGLVARARTLGYRVIQLVTNGRRLAYKGYARELVDAGLTEALIPLWVAEGAVHDEVTRVPQSFLQTLRGIRRLREAAEASGGPFRAVTITLGSPVTRWNVDALGELVALAARVGVPRLSLIRQRPAGGEQGPGEEAVRAALLAAAARAVDEHVALTLFGFAPLDDPALDRLREEALVAETPLLAPMFLAADPGVSPSGALPGETT